jgi:hypothetical protein
MEVGDNVFGVFFLVIFKDRDLFLFAIRSHL